MTANLDRLYCFWAWPALCLLLSVCLTSFCAAAPNGTVHITAGAPQPNPVTPGSTAKMQLSASVTSTDNTGKECQITSQTWTWSFVSGSLQFMPISGSGFTAAQPGPNTPAFSYDPPAADSQHSNANPTTLIAATTASTTPGYWKITAQADVSFSTTNCGNGSASATRDIIVAVGNAPAPNFTLSVSPASLSIAQGTGGTAQVTVAAVNGFNSDVTVSAAAACIEKATNKGG